MGAWDASIFGSDEARDVRDDYVECLEDGLDDAATKANILSEHLEPDHPEMNYDVWLALAAIQLRWGRLDDEVKTKSLELIESGSALEEWRELGASKATLIKREAALQQLKVHLNEPPPPRVEVKPRKYETPLRRGAILMFRTNGRHLVFHVSEAHVTKNDISPVLDALPWSSRVRPPRWWLWFMTLQLRGEAYQRESYKVAWLTTPVRVHRKGTVDFAEAGFQLLREGEQSVKPERWTSEYKRMNWNQLADHLNLYFSKKG